MRLMIRENGALLGDHISEAHTFIQRLKGLMFSAPLPEGHGLHISPCRSVHTFFMKAPIDVMHLDRNRVIVGLERELHPGKIGEVFRGTRSVVELPAGRLGATDAQIGQTVEFS